MEFFLRWQIFTLNVCQNLLKTNSQNVTVIKDNLHSKTLSKTHSEKHEKKRNLDDDFVCEWCDEKLTILVHILMKCQLWRDQMFAKIITYSVSRIVSQFITHFRVNRDKNDARIELFRI